MPEISNLPPKAEKKVNGLLKRIGLHPLTSMTMGCVVTGVLNGVCTWNGQFTWKSLAAVVASSVVNGVILYFVTKRLIKAQISTNQTDLPA